MAFIHHFASGAPHRKLCQLSSEMAGLLALYWLFVLFCFGKSCTYLESTVEKKIFKNNNSFFLFPLVWSPVCCQQRGNPGGNHLHLPVPWPCSVERLLSPAARGAGEATAASPYACTRPAAAAQVVLNAGFDKRRCGYCALCVVLEGRGSSLGDSSTSAGLF